jgi:hypothetical protein
MAKNDRDADNWYVIHRGYSCDGKSTNFEARWGPRALTFTRVISTCCSITYRTGRGARVRSPLTDLENDVMRVVWDAPPCTVEAVHQAVSRTRSLKET